MATRAPRRRLAAWGPVAVLVAAMLTLGVLAWLDGWHLGADSAVYRAGGWAFLHGEPLYDRTALTTLPPWVLLPFTYAPAAALLFVPLAAVPSGLVWGLIGTLSIASLAVVVRIFAGRLERRWTLGLATAAAIALEPVWKTVFLGQINLVLMALVVVDVLVLCAGGSRWGGVPVGVAAAIKLVPLIFVPHLLLTRQWRDALRALGTFAGLQAVMFALSPTDAVEYWTAAATDPGRVGAVHWIFNQSLDGLVSRASTLAPWSLELAVAVGALLAVPAGWLVLRLHRRGDAPGALLVSAFYGRRRPFRQPRRDAGTERRRRGVPVGPRAFPAGQRLRARRRGGHRRARRVGAAAGPGAAGRGR
jgi:alpha-1,2-mannosyltransferase